MSSVPKFTPAKVDHPHSKTEICPLCEQPIAGEERAEIWARIKARQKEQETAHAAELARQVEQAVKTATATLSKEHGEAVNKFKAQLAQKDEDANAREEKARKQAMAEAKKQHDADLKKEHEKHENAEQKNKVLTAQLEKFKEDRDKDIEQEVVRQTGKIREVLAKDKDDALNTKDAKHFEEKQKLQSKLQAVQRQLEKERADHLGDGQEIDILNELRAALPKDKIDPIAKGEPGADIRHEIMYRGKVCGTILYESKNRMRWSYDYSRKLRKDQMAARADHAILAAIKFPSGKQNITIEDNVLVVNPRHVVTIATLLRDITIDMHKLRASAGQRDGKRDQVYKFITSSRCSQLLIRQEEVTDSLFELDKKELKQHQKIWKDRGTMLRQLEKAQIDFRGELDTIIEG